MYPCKDDCGNQQWQPLRHCACLSLYKQADSCLHCISGTCRYQQTTALHVCIISRGLQYNSGFCMDQQVNGHADIGQSHT